MYTCANCTLLACEHGGGEMPKNCPMLDADKLEGILNEYHEPETNRFFVNCSGVEAEGYCQWPRLRETVEFCKAMGYKKIGLAFCGGLRREGKVVADIFRKHGFEVSSVVCKVGGIDKNRAGIPDSMKIHPGGFEPMCNPITQARLLNEEHTDFNVVVGLCVGHDSLFLKNADAPSTVLIAKDRVMGNNPCAAVYTAESYCRSKL